MQELSSMTALYMRINEVLQVAYVHRDLVLWPGQGGSDTLARIGQVSNFSWDFHLSFKHWCRIVIMLYSLTG